MRTIISSSDQVNDLLSRERDAYLEVIKLVAELDPALEEFWEIKRRIFLEHRIQTQLFFSDDIRQAVRHAIITLENFDPESLKEAKAGTQKITRNRE